MTPIIPYAAYGPIDREMLAPYIEIFGPGKKLKLACPKCHARVRRWPLPAIQNLNGQERSFWACHCACTVHLSSFPINRLTWAGIVQMVEAVGYVAMQNPDEEIPPGCRVLGRLDIPPPLFGDN